MLLFVRHQTIKAAHIATVRKLPKPPHLIMRIMDCVLLLFRKRLDTVVYDVERNCTKPSWSESLKVGTGADCIRAVSPIFNITVKSQNEYVHDGSLKLVVQCC